MMSTLPYGDGFFVTARGELRHRRAHPLFFGEFAGVLNHVSYFGEGQPRFAHKPLKRAFAEVFCQRFGYFVLMPFYAFAQFFESVHPERHGQGFAALKKFFLTLKYFVYILYIHCCSLQSATA